MHMRGSTPCDPTGTIWGYPLSDLLPTPVPARYRLVPPEERRWRGIGALHLWLVGHVRSDRLAGGAVG